MDEYDYLFVGKTLLAGGHWPTHSYIFGWDFNWLLLAWGDNYLGGISGARLISALLGIVSIAGLYAFVMMIWRNRVIALLASLLMSVEAAHLFSSSLATYDIISYTFFVWSLPTLIFACRAGRYQWLWTVFGSALLVCAVLSKYTAIIYLPIFACIVFFYAPKQAMAGLILITSALTAYALQHYEQLQVLYDIQISGAHGSNATKSDIAWRAGRQLFALLLFSSVSAAYALFFVKEHLVRLLLLLLMGLPLFIYHLLGQNVISLQKHLLYSSTFLIPVMAWGLYQVSYHLQTVFRPVFIAVIVSCFAATNYQQLQIMRSSYPDVQALIPLANQMREQESVLSEDPYLFRYLLNSKVDQSQIKETTWLDNNRDGIHEFKDIQQAVWDRKFSYVFLNDQQHAKGNKKLRTMLNQRGYVTLLNQPYQLNTMSGSQRSGVLSLHARSDSLVALRQYE